MRTASPALIAFLKANTAFVMADLFTFTLTSGTVLRYTNVDVPIVSGGNTFLANSVKIDGLKYSCSVGLDVDEQTLTIAATSTDLVGGVPFLQALVRGAFDGASVKRERAFMSAWGTAPVGTVTLFAGRVSSIGQIGRVEAQVSVKSGTIILDQQMPRNTFQTGCMHTLYDAGCTAVKASFTTTGTVAAGSGTTYLNWSGILAAHIQGRVSFTSGANAGVSRTVAGATAGTLFSVAYPLPAVPAAGDTFTISFGCDKTQATCLSRFNNIANFRGFPFTPVAEQAF